MAHYRTEYRAAAKAALAAAFSDVTLMSAWAQNIDAEKLPVIGVVTPSERSTPDSHSNVRKGTLLQVVLKRRGGDDIEDVLDDDSTAIEAAVIGAIRTRDVQCLLEEVTTVVNGEGAQRIGTVTASFRVTSWRAAV